MYVIKLVMLVYFIVMRNRNKIEIGYLFFIITMSIFINILDHIFFLYILYEIIPPSPTIIGLRDKIA